MAAIGPRINGDSCRDCHAVGWFSVAQLLRRGLEGNSTIDESDEINSIMWERTFGWISFRSLLHSLRCLLQVAFDSGQYACHHHSSNGQFGSVQFLKLRQKTSFQWYLWVRGRNTEQLNFWIDSEAIAVHSAAPSWTRKTPYVTLGRSKQFDGKRLENWISLWYDVLPMQSAVGFFFSRNKTTKLLSAMVYIHRSQCMNQILETYVLQLGKRTSFTDPEMPHCLGTNFLTHETTLFWLSRAG